MASRASQLSLILFITCEQVAELTSEARERELRWHEWLAVRAHFVGCWSCRQFEKHLQFLARACNLLAERERESVLNHGPSMPAALREKLARLRVGASDDTAG